VVALPTRATGCSPAWSEGAGEHRRRQHHHYAVRADAKVDFSKPLAEG